jgi:hypothetical protein
VDTGTAYLHTRDRFVDVVRTTDLDVPIPATPGWNVGDLLRHVVGVASDVVAGDTDQYAQPEWTARQVEARAAERLYQLVEEWDGAA